MRAQLNRIAEIGAEFAKLGVQMGMPTGFDYFSKKKDWLDGVQVIYTSPFYKVSAKSTLEDDTVFTYKDIKIALKRREVDLVLDITDEQLEGLIKELEAELNYLKSTEGLLELRKVIDDTWAKTEWVV